MDKDSLRKTYLSYRKTLSASQAQSKILLITQRLIDFVSWEKHKVIHLYLPILQNNEIDTFLIIQYLRAELVEVRIAVPKVEPNHHLGHYFLTKTTQLESNQWGIPEPVNATPATVEQIDLVLVPMLIFDRDGHRIGYGKGYYDRFLAQCQSATRKIGLCYFDPVKSIEVEPTDVAMDAVVTPDGVWEF